MAIPVGLAVPGGVAPPVGLAAFDAHIADDGERFRGSFRSPVLRSFLPLARSPVVPPLARSPVVLPLARSPVMF
jgi:hypothetical protein